MKATKKEKIFDCLKMKRDIQAKIYAETAGMNFAEWQAYLARRLQNTPFAQHTVTRLAA